MSSDTRHGKPWLWVGVAVAVVAVTAGAGLYAFWGKKPEPAPPPSRPRGGEGDIAEQVHSFCGSACHRYPPAESFPRRYWKDEVERGFRFFENSGLALRPPPIEDVIRYYEARAPEELPDAKIEYARHALPVRFERTGWTGPEVQNNPAVSFVDVVHLTDAKNPQLLACDMRNGPVMLLSPRDPSPKWRVLAKLEAPAHAEVVDLDGDGVKDLLVADLGSFSPTERNCGRVVWLRGKPDGTFTPYTLLEGVGRVADVQAAHFRGKDRLDLVVAAFGLNQTGALMFLENQTTDWARPKFVRHIVERKTGAIHVPVTDLDGDGRPDFVCLFSQEHEQVVAYLNKGGGKFEAKTLWAGPHPGYGSSGIQLVDLNGDGKQDILYTNGDVLDEPYLFKPYHGIQWLENKGGVKFDHHWIAPMYGVHRAVAADLTGSGRKDIVAVSFLPAQGFPQRKERKADALVIFEQTARGKWERHSLAKVDCDHTSCVAGDVFGTGRPDLVLGNFGSRTDARPVVVWRNQGAAQGRLDPWLRPLAGLPLRR